MGMSTHVMGFKPADDKWRRMKEAYAACDAAGVPPPDEVLGFFDHVRFDCIPEHGAEVMIERTQCCTEWHDDSRSGFDVDVRKLPADVHVLRFYNSW